jgi:hypothetical protein
VCRAQTLPHNRIAARRFFVVLIWFIIICWRIEAAAQQMVIGIIITRHKR